MSRHNKCQIVEQKFGLVGKKTEQYASDDFHIKFSENFRVMFDRRMQQQSLKAG